MVFISGFCLFPLCCRLLTREADDGKWPRQEMTSAGRSDFGRKWLRQEMASAGSDFGRKWMSKQENTSACWECKADKATPPRESHQAEVNQLTGSDSGNGNKKQQDRERRKEKVFPAIFKKRIRQSSMKTAVFTNLWRTFFCEKYFFNYYLIKKLF